MIHSHSKIWEVRVEGAYWVCLRPTNCPSLPGYVGLSVLTLGQSWEKQDSWPCCRPSSKGTGSWGPSRLLPALSEKGLWFFSPWHIQNWADQGYGCLTNQVSQEFPRTVRQTELVSSGRCSVTEPQTGLGPGDRWV